MAVANSLQMLRTVIMDFSVIKLHFSRRLAGLAQIAVGGRLSRRLGGLVRGTNRPGTNRSGTKRLHIGSSLSKGNRSCCEILKMHKKAYTRINWKTFRNVNSLSLNVLRLCPCIVHKFKWEIWASVWSIRNLTSRALWLVISKTFYISIH